MGDRIDRQLAQGIYGNPAYGRGKVVFSYPDEVAKCNSADDDMSYDDDYCPGTAYRGPIGLSDYGDDACIGGW